MQVLNAKKSPFLLLLHYQSAVFRLNPGISILHLLPLPQLPDNDATELPFINPVFTAAVVTKPLAQTACSGDGHCTHSLEGPYGLEQ
jgi:hypothetical protein